MRVPRRRGRRVATTVGVALALTALPPLVTAASAAPTGGPASPVGAPTAAGLVNPAHARTRVHVPLAPGAGSAIVVAAAGRSVPAGSLTAVVTLTPTGGAAALTHLAATSHALAATTRATLLRRLQPPAAAGARVVAWARATHLTVVAATPWDVTVAGPADQLAAAFGTHLVTAALPSGGRYVRPVTPPRLPATLAGVATTVSGLSTRRLEQPLGASDISLGDYGYTGDQLRDAYGLTRDPTAGAGITVATVQFTGFNPVDVETYAAQAGIPLFKGQITIVPLDGATEAEATTSNDSNSQEADLDIETILAVAPMARQIVYVAPSGDDAADAAVYGRLAADAAAGKVQVASSSWGICEQDEATDTSDLNTVHTDLNKAVEISGVTFSAASGDDGSADCNTSSDPNPTDSVDFPASDPSTVAVGGTSLPSTSGADSQSGYQTAWPDSGGGVSTLFGQPHWQSAGVGAATGREVPDIALDADPNTGVPLIFSTGPGSGEYIQGEGGTSLASPLFAGLLASALSAAGHYHGLGDIHPTLYDHPGDFQDVVGGSNGSFTAGVGYDEVTGLGAPRLGALAADLGLVPAAHSLFHAVSPQRIVDTRRNAGTGTHRGRLAAGHPLVVTPPVPAGATAVAVTVTAINPTESTHLSIYPTGSTTGALTSSVNAASSGGTPNMVIVKLSGLRQFTVANSAGDVDVAIDLRGYFEPSTPASPGDGFTPVNPYRVLDTRRGLGAPRRKVGTHATITVKVTGVGGVPTSADAVALNLTAVDATASTYASIYPAGDPAGRSTSVVNANPGSPVADMAITRVSASGEVTLYNYAGSVDLVADILGYYSAGHGSGYIPVDPIRVLDTRVPTPDPIPGGDGGYFPVAADGSLATAVTANLTGVSPTTATYLTLFPYGENPQQGVRTSTLNLRKGEVRANLATVGTTAGVQPAEWLFNYAGSVNAVVDIDGFFTRQPTALRTASVSLAATSTGITAGSPDTFTARVLVDGRPVRAVDPGATVTFLFPDGTVAARVAVNAAGMATATTALLSPGVDAVTAVLDADGTVEGATGTVTVTVTDASSP